MRRPAGVAAVLFAALLGCVPGRAFATTGPPAPAPPTSAACAECGMSVEIAGRFSARLESGGATLYFCDIGDLVAYLGRKRPQGFAAAVRDYPSGEWLDAAAAFFVIDKKAYPTPMGWGVAAFRDRSAAGTGALGFDALRQALR